MCFIVTILPFSHVPPLFSLFVTWPLCSLLWHLSRRRSWPSRQEPPTPWKVWRQTPSTPSPLPLSPAKALELSLMKWCRGRHKPVRLNSPVFTYCTHVSAHVQLLHCNVWVLCRKGLYTCFVLSSWPGKVYKLSFHSSICFVSKFIRPSVYIWLCLSPSAQLLSFFHSQVILANGDGAPINVSIFLLLVLLSYFPLCQYRMS